VNVLVTGGGGFLGFAVVSQLLDRGHAVRSLSRNNYPFLADKGVRQIQGDLIDATAVEEACRGCEVVFHVAAKAGFWGPYHSFYQPNVLGTQTVLQACLNSGVQQLIYTSSPSVVFGHQPHRGADETLPYPTRFESFYPQTKAMGEQIVLAAHGSQLKTISLRPHLIFGPQDPHLLPRVLQRAQTGTLVQVGSGDNQVDLTFVEDAAWAHLLAMDALTRGVGGGEAYFITSGAPVPLWPWIGELLAALELPPVKRRVSPGLARGLGLLLEWAHLLLPLQGEPRLTRFLAAELASDHYYSIEKARRDLGYVPRVSMDEAMKRTMPYLRQVLAVSKKVPR
jgi:nucleoside-diphosphate-sugar epimerase